MRSPSSASEHSSCYSLMLCCCIILLLTRSVAGHKGYCFFRCLCVIHVLVCTTRSYSVIAYADLWNKSTGCNREKDSCIQHQNWLIKLLWHHSVIWINFVKSHVVLASCSTNSHLTPREEKKIPINRQKTVPFYLFALRFFRCFFPVQWWANIFLLLHCKLQTSQKFSNFCFSKCSSPLQWFASLLSL